MAANINTNIQSLNAQRNLGISQNALSQSMQRLSSGLRINSAKDDAAGLAISERFSTQIRGLTVAARNANDGISLAQTAEGAMASVTNNLQRMRELAVQSANDTLTSTERAYTDQEYSQLIDEIDRIAAVTNYNGMRLISSGAAGTTANERFGLGGTGGTGSALWIDANDAVGLDSITITIDTLTTTDLSINTTTLSDQAASVASITALDESIDSVNTMRSNMGAFINRLEHAINNLMVSNTNQQAAESLIRDVDFASETTQFTRNQILTQSGTAMLSQSNMLPQGVLQLLQ